ncbi:MAG TPA: DUF5995 family protein, partial [Dehalococcoidia bacterium]
MTRDETLVRISSARWYSPPGDFGQLVRLIETRTRALECARDGRAPYTRVCVATARMLLDQSHADAPDGGWAMRVELQLAQAYLRAQDLWDRAQTGMLPGPWRAVFSILRQEPVEPYRAVHMSMLAHVAYELPLVLARSDLAARV